VMPSTPSTSTQPTTLLPVPTPAPGPSAVPSLVPSTQNPIFSTDAPFAAGEVR
jgi:hypothetical protein